MLDIVPSELDFGLVRVGRIEKLVQRLCGILDLSEGRAGGDAETCFVDFVLFRGDLAIERRYIWVEMRMGIQRE